MTTLGGGVQDGIIEAALEYYESNKHWNELFSLVIFHFYKYSF